VVDYIFEINQEVILEVYDFDSKSHSNYIGQATATIAQIVGAKNSTLVLNL